MTDSDYCPCILLFFAGTELYMIVAASDLQYCLHNGCEILNGLSFNLNKGEFLAVVGENGASKTTLLDLLMGFRRRTGGQLRVMEMDPGHDAWEARARVGYLSEKVDIPGDWDGAEFLAFHRRFTIATISREKSGWRSNSRLAVRSAWAISPPEKFAAFRSLGLLPQTRNF